MATKHVAKPSAVAEAEQAFSEIPVDIDALQAQIQELQAKVAAAKAEKRGGILQQMRKDIETYEIQPYELGFNTARDSAEGTARKEGSSSPLAGRTIAPKYRNPLNFNETWSARGQKPKWLVAELEKGAKLEDFLITQAQTVES